MRSALLTLCISAYTSSLGAEQLSLYVVGSCTPPVGVASVVRVISRDRTVACSPDDVPKGVLCHATLPSEPSALIIEFRARGYKPYTINVPRARFTNNIARVTIGDVVLQAAELRVVQVISGRRDDGARIFDITLENRLPRDVLIKELRIKAYRRGDEVLCFENFTSAFELRDKLTVTVAGDGEFDAAGCYIERIRGANHEVSFSGKLAMESCDGFTALQLLMPTAIAVARETLSAIQIVLPREFRMIGRQSMSFMHSDKEDGTSRFPVNEFDEFRFELSTDEQDMLPMEAIFSQQMK